MIRIGTVLSGAVDRHGDERIQTKFFMLGVPLILLERRALADATSAKLRSNGRVERTAPATSSLMADDARRE